MKEFCAIAIVNFYDDVSGDTLTDRLVITNIDTYGEAMAQIEEYYGRDIESVNITLLEGPFLQISAITCDRIMRGDPDDDETPSDM